MQGFEWDEDKAEANWREHGVRFAKAVEVFDDQRRKVEPDYYESEDRWRTIGMTQDGLLVVVYTYRCDDIIRIISARRAEPCERRHYGNRKV